MELFDNDINNSRDNNLILNVTGSKEVGESRMISTEVTTVEMQGLPKLLEPKNKKKKSEEVIINLKDNNILGACSHRHPRLTKKLVEGKVRKQVDVINSMESMLDMSREPSPSRELLELPKKESKDG